MLGGLEGKSGEIDWREESDWSQLVTERQPNDCLSLACAPRMSSAMSAPLAEKKDSSHHVAFIALPAGFDKSKWKAEIQKRTDAVICLSVALNKQSSNATQRCPASAAELKELVAGIGDATERTTHVSAQFAVMWDAAQCKCTRFADVPAAWETPCAQVFEMTLLGSATEHVDITGLNGYADKYCSHILIRDALAQLAHRPAYILGGCFGINANLISYQIESELRNRKLSRTPLLLKSTDASWPDPVVLVDCSDALSVSQVTPETTPHCTCVALTVSAKPSESRGPCGSTEHNAQARN